MDAELSGVGGIVCRGAGESLGEFGMCEVSLMEYAGIQVISFANTIQNSGDLDGAGDGPLCPVPINGSIVRDLYL